MTNRIMAAALRLPSIQRFLECVADDLGDYRSVLVLLPKGIDAEAIWEALLPVLQRRGYEQRTVPVTEVGPQSTPAAELGRWLGARWPSPEAPRTVSNLAASSALPDIVRLTGLEHLADHAQRGWLEFVGQWAQAIHARVDSGAEASRLCAIVPAEGALRWLPPDDTYLSLRWWWGFPSRLEGQLLCRMLSGADGDAAMRWREYVLPSLAPNDVGLLDALWEDIGRPAEHLHEALRAYALRRGWDAQLLADWREHQQIIRSALGRMHGCSQAPPVPARRLWAHGAFGWSEEYGAELHVAAFAALGSDLEVQHRMWRGQAELMLPFLDQVRLRLCDHLTDRYGADWPVRWLPPLSVDDEEAAVRNPQSCQWGHLDTLLRECASLAGEKACQRVASAARPLRNRLAHYVPVNATDYARLVALADAVGRRTPGGRPLG